MRSHPSSTCSCCLAFLSANAFLWCPYFVNLGDDAGPSPFLNASFHHFAWFAGNMAFFFKSFNGFFSGMAFSSKLLRWACYNVPTLLLLRHVPSSFELRACLCGLLLLGAGDFIVSCLGISVVTLRLQVGLLIPKSRAEKYSRILLVGDLELKCIPALYWWAT